MPSKRDSYRSVLEDSEEWESYLLSESGLPGPRANLELAFAVADVGDEEMFLRFIEKYNEDSAPTNTPGEFLAFCGIVGLGRMITEGKLNYLSFLRQKASDSRWRVREAVVFALLRVGEVDSELLLSEIKGWSKGNLFERRAAAAAVSHPSLLKGDVIGRALKLMDVMTDGIEREDNRHNEEFKTLRKGMAYCWSVVVAADPEIGKQFMEKWFGTNDADIRWIMTHNLKKARLQRADPNWVDKWKRAMES